MTRTERLLRLARLRGDRAAIAILEADRTRRRTVQWDILGGRLWYGDWTEAELRAAWGDR